ncbi:hypothetical protein Clacol_009300 [Clathrus columnatus]|uniref:Uncharacterized protein n=1 Tax=Clathrus columnatus TaxID=1419009 RepID=A0AAV5AMS1_9AGAM|nr:hypothetical protein Clacol_009300 [Clathrus columnatus]
MPVKVSNALIDLRSCFKINSCRYTSINVGSNHSSRFISSTTGRFVHRQAYSAVVFQHAPLFSPTAWIDKQHSQMMESRDGVVRICSRTYATAALTDEPGTSRVQALLATIPNLEKVPPDEEVELVEKDEAKFLFTERAAEKLSNISTLENDPNVSLRVAVESGGCHGYQYKLELTSENAVDDYRFVHPKYRNAAIVVDAVSLGLLKGSTLDYATELIGSSFRIVDNPQAKSAGCGCGVSWEANWSPEYEERETEASTTVSCTDADLSTVSAESITEKHPGSSRAHRIMSRKTHLVAHIENGQMDLAETLRDEYIASGIHIKRHPIYAEAAIDAWRHKSPDERTNAFYNWLRLIPHATCGHIRQTRLALTKVRDAIFLDPTDLNTIACFGLVVSRKGFANAFFPEVMAHIGRLASPTLSRAFFDHCQTQAKAFYSRFHKETYPGSEFSVWNSVKHNNHYARILCIAGYSHEAVEWVKMLVEHNIPIDSFTWTLLWRDFTHLKLNDLVIMTQELRTQAVIKGLTEDLESDDNSATSDRANLPSAQELAAKLQGHIETTDEEAIEALWHEIAVTGRSLDLWVMAIMKFYQNNEQPRLVLEQFLNYYMCIGVPRAWILHHISSRPETSREALHSLLSVKTPPKFKPAAGGRFPSTHTLSIVWNALAALTANDAELSSLYQTFLYYWDNNYSSTSESLPSIDPDNLWKNISVQYPPVITPDTVMFHVFISRFAKSGKIDITLAILNDMHTRGIRPDTHNWTAVAGMYAKASDLERATRILNRMEETIFTDSSSPASHTLNLNRVRNRRGPIHRPSNWMPSPNLVTYTNIWRGLIDCGHYEAAKEFSKRLESAGYIQGMNERTENVARLLQERHDRHNLHQTQRIGWKEELSKRERRPS